MILKIKSRGEKETSVNYSILVENHDNYENYFEAQLIVISLPEDEPLADRKGYIYRYKVPQLEEVESRNSFMSFAEAYIEGIYNISKHVE